jgi:hypothetical protein
MELEIHDYSWEKILAFDAGAMAGSHRRTNGDCRHAERHRHARPGRCHETVAKTSEAAPNKVATVINDAGLSEFFATPSRLCRDGLA